MAEEIANGHIMLAEQIGSGKFSQVRRGVDVHTGQEMAVKIIQPKYMQKFSRDYIESEFEVLTILGKSKYVLDAYEKFEYEDCLCFAVELARHDMFDTLQKYGPMRAPMAWYFFRQLIKGVNDIHRAGLCHRDLKTENVFITCHEEDITTEKVTDPAYASAFVLKIGDVGGWCNHTQNGEKRKLKSIAGTTMYFAPEIYYLEKSGGYDGEQADIWACAMILFYMHTGFPPWEKPDAKDRFFKYIFNNDFDGYWAKMSKHMKHLEVPDEVRDLLSKIFRMDPEQRIGLVEIAEHPYWKMSFPQLNLEKRPTTAAAPTEKKSKFALPKFVGGSKAQKIKEAGPAPTTSTNDAAVQDLSKPPELKKG